MLQVFFSTSTQYPLAESLHDSNNRRDLSPLSLMSKALQLLPIQISAAVITFFTWTQTSMAGIFGESPNFEGTADEGTFRNNVIEIIKKVLSFMALVAVVLIVIAGIRLVLSQGEEAEKDKAKKTILYVVIGLIVIIIARALVDIIITAIS